MGGQRVQRGTGKSRKGPVIAAGVVAALAAAYFGFCAWVDSSERIMPNVSVSGVNISNMTEDEAENALKAAFSISNHTNREELVELWCDSFMGYLGADDFAVDTKSSIAQAKAIGREFFPANGVKYMHRMLSRTEDLALTSVELTQNGESKLEELMDKANEQLGVHEEDQSYQTDLEQGILSIRKGYTRSAVDTEATQEATKEAFLKTMQGKRTPVQMTVNKQPPQTPDFTTIHEEVYSEPKEPEYDPKTGDIIPHEIGVDFSVEEAETAFQQAAEGETIQVPLTLTKTKETSQSLKAKLFQDLLGQGTTTVGGTANRKTNVKLSAQACNGIVLMPGEVFSYNNTTGSRTADKGYLPAPVYVGSQSQDDIGGGICQTSSTIYYAVLHSTLEIVERHNHKFATGYVPDGMDATVYFGSLDFRFKNNTSYPVKMVTQSYDQNGKRYLTVKLYGTNESGRYAVPSQETFDWVSPTENYVADESIPRGTTKVDSKQNPYTGRSARTYRTIYEADGTKVTTETLGTSKYSMRPKTIYYNPQDGSPSTWPNGTPPAVEPPVKPEAETPTTPETTPTPEENQPATETTPTPEENQPATETTPTPEESQPATETAPTPGESQPATETTPAPEENQSSPESAQQPFDPTGIIF